MSGLRTIYNGPARTEIGALRADEVALGDFVFASTDGRVVLGVVDRRTVPATDRPTVRLRMHDEITGRFAGEATFDADHEFRVRRINTNHGGIR